MNAALTFADAVAAPPLPQGGRTMWLVVVPRCPFCGTMHSHRAVREDLLFSWEAVRECPATGWEYTLNVVKRQPAAVIPR